MSPGCPAVRARQIVSACWATPLPKSSSAATTAQLEAQADMYKYVIEKYFEIIPAAQRYGITFWSPQDRPSGSAWLANQPVGIWNGQWIRKVGYKAVVEALESKAK